MAEEQGRGPPSTTHREDLSVQQREDEARHRLPPVGAPEDSRYHDDRHQRPNMAAPVSLPSIQDPHSAYGQPAYARSYPPHPDPRGDPRASSYNASPNSVNGYPPPQPGAHQQLPPLQPQGGDPRSPGYPPPPESRDDFYRRQQQQPPPQQYDPYYQDHYNRQGPPPPGRYPDYPPPGPGAPRYDYGPPGPPRYEYGPGGPNMQQAAPRQRTSIACRYCRKRKIRCSGYQSAPGGKCVNCSRMNQECIFQPVSSSSSTAFVPVSALQGGIPPGTPLYGAYGQPLPQGSLPPPPAQGYAPQPGNGGYYPQQALPSPTGGYSPYDAQRGRRRPRDDEGDEQLRPPPPDPNSADDPRRRSPASSSNHSSPGYMNYQPPGPGGYDPRAPPARHSPVQPSSAPSQPTGDERAAAAIQRQSNSSTPAASSSSVMSLNNLVDNPAPHDIDRNMLGRLNRPPPRR
ncbi:hypothetical protein GCG54_00012542 [Colletotrichum gloeosporioides]|uniref:Zn(2)-C6 fungal-type domain-containing protein n=2 Tax=Colletotrichum gloeosporioides TaxID=474922 RepID=A0A8H4FIK4_COLGL|nr:uncharacterized protein GCG54_00012542 [Colletotrichum gloeosporioides]KAF3802294.1 hypothetical protein GCG54_00012542 [Colletotrichum gloeosporioides]